MTTTRQQAIENAARTLRNYENWHVQKYGGAGSQGLDLGSAWTALAIAIGAEHEPSDAGGDS